MEICDVTNDLLLAELQFIDLSVEIDLKLVNGTFQKNHLLALLLRVDLHVFRHFVIVAHLEVEGTESGAGVLDILLIFRGLTLMHVFLFKQLLDLLFPVLTLNLALFALLLGVRLIVSTRGSTSSYDGTSFSLAQTSDGISVGFALTCFFFLIFKVHSFLAREFLFHHLLELLNVAVEEFTHFGNAESLHIRGSANGLDCEFLEVKVVVELFLELVEACTVVRFAPRDFLGSLLGGSQVCLFEQLEVFGVNVEVLVADADNLVLNAVEFAKLVEFGTQVRNFSSDTFLLCFSKLQAVIFLCAQFRLLNRIHSGVSNIINLLREAAK